MTPMPPDENIYPAEPEGSLLVRMLYDEQTRLRAKIEDIQRKQEEADQKNDKEGDDKKEEKEDGDKDKKEGDEKKDDEKEKEKKPPLLQRIRAWIKQHPIATILIIVGAIVLIIACILLWNYLESYENTDDAFVDGHTDPISARISGFVTEVYVEDTNRVKKGQLLIELDPRDYVVSQEQSMASIAQAEAGVRAQTPNLPITATAQSTQVTNTQLSVESAEANLAAAQERSRSALADLRQAEANAANAEREEKRYRQLVDKQEVSRELYDQRATQAKTEEAMVASRREMAAAAAKGVTQADAQLHQAQQQAEEARHNMPRQLAIQHETLAMRQAEALSARARADQSALNVQYTKIYAPADGVVGDRSVQIGTQVQPGQEMLAVTQTGDIWVTANFKETQVKRMRPGQSVTIHVDALSQDFDGYIEALPGASGAVYSLLPPENATGNYVKVVQRLPVRIRFKPNQRGAERLAPGMSVEPKVWLQ